MVTSKYAFVLDLQSTQSQISIPVTKGDTARVWYISLADGGKPVTIEDGCVAKIEIKRPTGTYLLAFCPIEKNSVIKYDFAQDSITKNTAAVGGVHHCSVVLSTAEGERIGTAKFSMVVDDNIISSDDVNLSDDDLDFIAQIVVDEQTRQAAELQRQEYYEDFKNRVDIGEFKGDRGEKGDKGDTGDKGDKGDPYVPTEEDFEKIVDDVIERIPDIDFGEGGGNGGTVTPSGVHVGADTPPDSASIWIDPSGEPTSTEEWEFEMSDGTFVTKTMVVTESEG